MRISTAQYYESTAANYQRTSTTRSRPAKRPAAWCASTPPPMIRSVPARLLQLGQQARCLISTPATSARPRVRLSLQETALDSIGNGLQRAKELALSASNGGYTDADRQAYASELGQIKSKCWA